MKKFNFSKGLVIGLLTLALCLTCFAAAKVSAEDAAATPTKTTAVAAQYDPAAETVIAESNAYVYVLKAASGNNIKAGTGATGQMASKKISIADLGIKSTAKDVYLYVCDKEVEVDETVSANLTIKGNANKVVGVIDYTQADYPNSLAVLSAYYVDKTTKKRVDIAVANTYWSTDGEKWYAVNSDDTKAGRKDSNNAALKDGFMGKDLAGMLESGGTIYLKQVGTSDANGAQFGSKVVKVKIAKQAKAVKAKIDVSKDTIALKNGFDFAVVTKLNANATEYTEYGTWWTILPALKTATVSTEGESIVGGLLGSGADAKSTVYKPLDKKNTNAGKAVEVTVTGGSYYEYSYTKYAVKALSIDKLFEKLEDSDPTKLASGDFRIAIRKSATEKKPASAVTLVELDYQTEKPLVITKDNVKGQFLVASADEFTKKGLSLNEVVGFPGYTVSGNDKLIATEGFDSTFKVKAAATTIKERDEGSSFEYAVVATADYAATGDNAIDWTTVKWKKFDPSKLKITEKLSGKYNTVKGNKKTATLKATASADISVPVQGDDPSLDRVIPDDYGRSVINEDVIKSDTKALLLIRRVGDKSSSKRASLPIALYVAKEGKKYNLYSTVSNGEVAYKYDVVFFKYNEASGDDPTAADYKAAGWYKDESVEAISGWSQKAKTGVTLPALTDAEYWHINAYNSTTCAGTLDTGNNSKYEPASADIPQAAGTDKVAKGAYQIDIDATQNSTVRIAIREYANVKVTGTAAVKGTTEDTAIDNSSMQLASIEKGKVATYNATSKKFEVASATTVTAYVGSEIVINTIAYTSPNGYAANDDPVFKVVDGQTYRASDKTLTVTPGKAEEEYTITFYHNKTYTVKLKEGSLTGAALTDIEPAIAGGTIKFKATLPTASAGTTVKVKNGDTVITATNDIYSVAVDSGDPKDIEISIVEVDNKYLVPLTNAITDVTITYTSGFDSTTNQATHGTDLVFTLTPASGKKITAVKYQVQGESQKTLTLGDSYTIPGSEITAAITIIPTVENE